MSVQVQFLDVRLVILSIPLDSYSQVFHGIAKLALSTWRDNELATKHDSCSRDNRRQGFSEDLNESEENFFNISITPTECSVICREELIDAVFDRGYLASVPGVQILPRRYFAIKVDSAGVERNSERILNLSSSLSAAQIPIFFLSTYFSDYMLVPTSVQPKVHGLLEKSNYSFSTMENSYIALHNYSSSTSTVDSNEDSGGLSVTSSRSASPAVVDGPSPLKKYNLHPSFDPTEILITGPRPQTDWDRVELAVIKILSRKPRYFSITSYNDEIAVMIEKIDAELFPKDSLLGSLNELYIPVSLDLRHVPVDVVGVVAEIASSLEENDIPMSFLSTALTSTVLVSLDYTAKAQSLCSNL